jgi:potassium efflux system protein
MLDAVAIPVQAKLRATPGVALRDLPIMRLESLARHWQFDARRLEQWQANARHAFAPYADSAMQLAQHRAA